MRAVTDSGGPSRPLFRYRDQGSRHFDLGSQPQESGKGFRAHGYAAGDFLPRLFRHLPPARRQRVQRRVGLSGRGDGSVHGAVQVMGGSERGGREVGWDGSAEGGGGRKVGIRLVGEVTALGWGKVQKGPGRALGMFAERIDAVI